MGTSWPPMDRRGPIVAEKDVRALEEIVGARLPDDYRAFLLAVNGGRTTEDHVQFTVRNGESNLNSLYSVAETETARDLAWHAKMMRERLPREVIPIGYDDFGSAVCVVLAGERRGEVWFFDTLNERPEDANPRVEWFKRRDMVRLASSFREFMGSLTPPVP
jgi:hypothetical protein